MKDNCAACQKKRQIAKDRLRESQELYHMKHQCQNHDFQDDEEGDEVVGTS